MSYRMTVTYSEALVRQAVRAFWRRTAGVGVFVAMLFLTGCLAFRLAEGDRSWVVGLLGAFLVFSALVLVVLYVSHLRNSLAKFRALASPQATFELDEQTFAVETSLGRSAVPWPTITELWRFESFWLVFYARAQFVTLPLATIPADARAFLLARVQAAGGKIIGSAG